MNLQNAIEVLSNHQFWRMGVDGYEMQEAKEITQAINIALEAMRCMNLLKNLDEINDEKTIKDSHE